MGLPRICTNKNSGFSLIEILVVLGMLSLLAAFTLFIGTDSYRGYSFRNERDTIVSILQKARSQAMSNVCLGSGCTGGEPHGVHFASGQYVIFQGSSFNPSDPNNEVRISGYNLDLTGSTMTDVIFTQLSGEATPTGAIRLTDPNTNHTSDITINSAGQIAWTN
jgi:prepilin-type N-terminal cleavage/methylation domain-containing protein